MESLHKVRIITLSAFLLSLNVGLALAQTPLETVAFFGFIPGIEVTGLGAESIGRYDAIATGPNGEIYVARSDAAPPGIFMLKNGVLDCISCNERLGFRDGLAAIALFNPGGQQGYPGTLKIAADKTTGVIYAADGRNRAVRKIYRDNNQQWHVTTVAGGCTSCQYTLSNLQAGQSYDATKVDLGTDFYAITVDINGNAWICTQGRLVKFTPGTPHATVQVAYVNSSYFSVPIDLDADSLGNIYVLDRGGYRIYQYSANGTLSVLNPNNATIPCPNNQPNVGNQRCWGGPIATANFNQPGFLAVSPDGTAIYVGGGDQTTISRVLTTTPGNFSNAIVTTYYPDGYWRVVDTYEPKYNYQTAAGNYYGYRAGGVRCVDSSGYLYVAWGLQVPRSLRRFTP